jgi:predicted ATPase
MDEARAAVSEGLSEVRRAERSFSEPELRRIEGELFLRELERDEAQRAFQEAIEVARRQGSRSFELRAALSLAHLWQNQNRNQDARRLLEEVFRWFTDGLDSPDPMEARELLALLSR